MLRPAGPGWSRGLQLPLQFSGCSRTCGRDSTQPLAWVTLQNASLRIQLCRLQVKWLASPTRQPAETSLCWKRWDCKAIHLLFKAHWYDTLSRSLSQNKGLASTSPWPLPALPLSPCSNPILLLRGIKPEDTSCSGDSLCPPSASTSVMEHSICYSPACLYPARWLPRLGLLAQEHKQGWFGLCCLLVSLYKPTGLHLSQKCHFPADRLTFKKKSKSFKNIYIKISD